MITSKFKAFGIFALILSVLLFAGICCLIYTLISAFFLGREIIPRGTLPPFGAAIFIFALVLMLIAIFNSWRLYAFNIKIDNTENTIFFQNIITRRKKLYNFKDFDSYLETYSATGKGGAYKNLYLLKNKRAEKIITGFYYENIDQLQDAISSIKYLGFEKNFSVVARKALLNKQIID